jgi:monofunctional biosynthetic peptidoglycan transglycosylase
MVAFMARLKDWRTWRTLFWACVLLFMVMAAHALWTLPDDSQIEDLVKHAPKTTALIEARAHEAEEAHRKPRRVQSWVSLTSMAPELVGCVLASEDARFFMHEGVDTAQLKEALQKDLQTHRYARGASTLTQQLAKNLFLSESKTLLRKLQELWVAHRLEEVLSKDRILELYLNEVEWGDGLYGAEAASRTYFDKPSRDLDLAEAAQLAAMLPAPRKLAPRQSPKALLRRAQHVLERVAEENLATPTAIAAAQSELTRSLQGGADPNANP